MFFVGFRKRCNARSQINFLLPQSAKKTTANRANKINPTNKTIPRIPKKMYKSYFYTVYTA